MQNLKHLVIGADGHSAATRLASSAPVTSGRLQVLLRPRMDANCMPMPPAAGDDLKANRFSQLVARWLDVFPDARNDPRIDFEDWVENATAITAWLGDENRQGVDLFIQHPSARIRFDADTHPVVEHFTWPSPADRSGRAEQLPRRQFNPAAPFILVGPELKAGDFVTYAPGALLPSRHDANAADAYSTNAGFLKHAGRHVEMCAYDDGEGDVEPDREIRTVLSRMRDAGHKEAVVKLRETKAGIATITLQGRSDKQIGAELLEQFEWSLIGKAGQENAFMVQARVPMEFEYRLVVVDGKLAAGAGCIEEFTPLDRTGDSLDLYDTRVRRQRGAFGQRASEVEDRPDVVKRYLDKAGRIVDDIQWMRASDAAGPSTFILDLCMVDGEVRVVELNAARNFGLYAMNYEAVKTQMELAAIRHLREASVTKTVTPMPASNATRRARP
ncbi:hypothetical protein ABIC83_002809 [Roseateles asaccharophilus]|uniref:hypothetical protein n=1 Tax=Roseateles asaccharophilus TaxID=582607 RepID=UPI003839059C